MQERASHLVNQQTESSKEPGFSNGRVLTVSGAHFLHDTYTAFLAPLLPLLISKLSLSLTLAGSLTLFLQLPSLLNPLVGYLADRFHSRLFIVLAPAITGTFMSIMGWADSYTQLALILLGAGVSVSLFHAPAPAYIAEFSGDRIGRGMSFFMAGGELGRTVGPLVAAWAVSVWGLEGIYRTSLLGWLISLLLFLQLPRARRTKTVPGFRNLLPAFRQLLLPVGGLLVARAFMLSSLGVFLPTLLEGEGASFFFGAAALSIYEAAGITGALLSGTLSDHFGRRPVLLVSMTLAPALLLVFLLSGGWLMPVVLVGLGFTSLSAQPVMLAVIQDQFPEQRALANGVYLAFSFAMRPLGAVIIGLVGDLLSLRLAFYLTALLALAVLPLIRLLPEPAPQRHP
jgi:FSR family fosmidomycin resistance protein-like MFS transporter